MHLLEPYYGWRGHYTAEEDSRSPFYGREYSEFEFTNHLYDHCIHPQWDSFGSPSLYMKILYADYAQGYVILEFMGEWNDCLHNDIMFLKREIIEHLMAAGLNKYLIIGENVLNFHYSDDCYYEEWFEELNECEGWIAALNFPEHVVQQWSEANIDSYMVIGGRLKEVAWRSLKPEILCRKVEQYVQKRLPV